MKVGTVSKVMLGGNADVSTKSGIIIDADVILGKAEGRTKDLKGLVLSNKLMFGKSVSRAVLATVSGVPPLSLPDAVAANIVSLIAFGGTELSSLPQGYKQLAYIESTGTQYIDLGIKGNENTKVSVEFRYHTASSATSSGRVFGSRQTSSSNAFATGSSSGVIGATGNKVFWCYDAQSFFVIDDPTFPIGDWQTVVFSATEHTLNGVSYGNDYNVVEFETPQNLKLFGFDNNGTMGYGIVDISSCKVWDNGVLIRDLVPCKNASNVVGMYDVVNDAFYQNAGTGDFIAGSAGIPTPTEPLSIVSNNGVLSYVDTELPIGYRRILGVSMNNNCYYLTTLYPTGADTLKFSYEWTNVNTACNVLGCYTTASAQDNLSLYISNSSSAKYLRYNGGIYYSYSLANKRYDVQITPTGSIGMETEDTWEQKTFTCSVPLCIGITGATATSAKFVGNLYGNVELVGVTKFIPCERASDGEIGYYDTANETFIEPTGTRPTSLGYDDSHYVLVAGGPVEAIRVSGNLVDFNETRIDNTTWASADKTKGFEVEAAVYAKNVGNSVIGNANCFGVFVPCKLGKSVSINFFDYTPMGSRCYYCEVDVDGKATTTPAQYATVQNVLTQKTFTITQPDSIGFVIEWYITSAQTRNYTKENYTVVAGTTPPTQYTPFNISTATTEILLSVGDYTDEQEVIAGNVTRKVGVKVLDGTENVGTSNATFTISISDRAPSKTPLVCSHFRYSNKTSSQTEDLTVISFSSTNIGFRYDACANAAAFKTWLANQYAAGTPVIVIYQLATETTESVTGQPMSVQQGTNIVEITQAALDNLELEASYYAGAEVTITEIENAQLSSDVEVTIS